MVSLFANLRLHHGNKVVVNAGEKIKMDRLIELLEEISDAETYLEEITESGDLEERLEAALNLEDLKAQHLKACEKEPSGE